MNGFNAGSRQMSNGWNAPGNAQAVLLFFFESANWKKEKPLTLAFLLGHVASKVGASSAESVASDLVSKFRNCFTIVCSKVYVLTWLGLISGDCCRSTRVTPRIGWVNEVNDGWENASL